MSTPYLQNFMTAQEYIEATLEQLHKPSEIPHSQMQPELVEMIFRLLTSKKFRKYALSTEYAAHIKASIQSSVEANEPIKLVFLGGCYKLWRLNEAPEADFAELFAYIYFTRWMQPVCAMYKPGVRFDFLLDDYIVPNLNNISENDVTTYRASRDALLDFISPYQPTNLNMTHTSSGSLFASKAAFESSLERAVKNLADTLPNGLPTLSRAEAASVELNTHASAGQLADPQWREKVELLHRAYYMARDETGYYAPATHKIISFTQPFAPGRPLAVGSTKDTVAKYWVGVGALKNADKSFRQLVLSPKQLEAATFDWEDVGLGGLSGKNFSRIRVLR